MAALVRSVLSFVIFGVISFILLPRVNRQKINTDEASPGYQLKIYSSKK
jgi:hypothetical protein